MNILIVLLLCIPGFYLYVRWCEHEYHKYAHRTYTADLLVGDVDDAASWRSIGVRDTCVRTSPDVGGNTGENLCGTEG